MYHASRPITVKGVSVCSKCSAGSFTSAEESTSCQPCLEGTYTASEGSQSCVSCTPGRYGPKTGATTCIGCAKGKYSASINLVSCSDCPAGSYSNTPAAATPMHAPSVAPASMASKHWTDFVQGLCQRPVTHPTLVKISAPRVIKGSTRTKD